MRRRHNSASIVTVAAALVVADGVVEQATIALGGVAPTPVRALAAEQALIGNPLDHEHVEAAAAVVSRSIESLRGAVAPAAVEPVHVSLPPAARAALEKLQAALGDFDVSAASSALADLERIAMPGAAGALSQLRSHVDSYEYEEGRALATRLLGQIGNGGQ